MGLDYRDRPSDDSCRLYIIYEPCSRHHRGHSAVRDFAGVSRNWFYYQCGLFRAFHAAMRRRCFNIKSLFVSYGQALCGFMKNIRFFS